MDLNLSPREAALQSDLRAWLETHYDFAGVLARTASAHSRDSGLWKGLIEGGWIERALPRRDALQESTIDASIIAEEFGRALVVEPFLRSAYLAACLAVEAMSPEDGAEVLAQIGAGDRRFACALYEPGGGFRLDKVATQAEARGNSWRLTGRKAMVLDGADADRILVSAQFGDGAIGLFLVAGEAAGLTRTLFHTIDDFAAADLTLEQVEAVPLTLARDLGEAVQAAVDRTITVVGAEALGAASAALDETARYAGERVQFGRKLASFQVIAHRLARMFVELEGLRGGLIAALAVADGSADDRAQAAAGLKVLIAEKGRFVVNQGVQVHGGVGTVNDYKVSHCFKRVFASDILFGNGDFHLDRYTRAMA